MMSNTNMAIATFFMRFLIFTGLFFSVEFIVKLFIFIDYCRYAKLGIGNCLAMRIFTCFIYKLFLGIDLIVKFHVYK